MLRVLGLDQSIRHSGFALYDVPGDERKMVCGSFPCHEKLVTIRGVERTVPVPDPDEQCELFALYLRRLIGRNRPDFIAWERALPYVQLYEKADLGMASSGWEAFVAAGRGNAGLVTAGDARAGFVPNPAQLCLVELQGIIRGSAVLYQIPHESVPVNTWRRDIFGKGYGSMSRPAAKAKAKEYCRRLGIPAANEDEAEAGCIARWASTCSQRFRMLRFAKDAEAAA